MVRIGVRVGVGVRVRARVSGERSTGGEQSHLVGVRARARGR